MMPPEELREEYSYRYTERLNLLCPEGEPTREQMDIAGREADEVVERLKQQNTDK